jgi:Sortase domain
MPAVARAAVLAVLALLVTGGLAGAAAPAPPRPAAARPGPASAPLQADTFRSARTYSAVAVPVRLRVPALHIDGPLQQLGRLPDGTVAVPARPDVAGWFAGGPRPGQGGPAVILGHVDSVRGPGVFYDLVTLKPGAAVAVDRADGSTVRFRVTRVLRVPKNRFPTDLVYAPTLQPTLRLVTCGGSFDYAQRSYRDNVIVFAARA